MKLVILLFINSVWAENPFLWSLCSRNDSQWTKHRTADNDFNFVKSWIKSIHLNSKCPSKEYKVISYGYENSDSLELMTRIDNETGKHIGKGWKIAYHYDEEEEFHAGYFYGTLDEQNLIYGSDIIFVYPDLKTVLVGEFVDSLDEETRMVSAKEGSISAYKCQNGILDIKVKLKYNSPNFTYDPPAVARISNNPTIQDPLQRKNIYIKTGPFGDSLFAKRDFSNGDLIAYYSGFWYETEEVNWENMTESEQWDFHKNLIHWGDDYEINVPKLYWNIKDYRATLGHKTNHSFTKKNVKFGWAYNPRFGHCRSIVATRNIKKHEELWVNYGYEDMENAPQWYIDVHKREIGSIPKRKRRSRTRT